MIHLTASRQTGLVGRTAKTSIHLGQTATNPHAAVLAVLASRVVFFDRVVFIWTRDALLSAPPVDTRFSQGPPDRLWAHHASAPSFPLGELSQELQGPETRFIPNGPRRLFDDFC
jgi:hypothetical protein